MSFVLTDLYNNQWRVTSDNVTGEISATVANDIKIVLTAKEGFKIVSATIIGVKRYPMTVSADGTTATRTFWERERGGSVEVTTESATTEQGIINHIENTTDNSTWYDDYNQWSVIIKANTGFKFATNAVASYEDENGDYHADPLTKNGVGSMVSGTIRNVTKTTPIIITGEVVDATVINVKNNIPNTTATGKLTASETATVSVKCADGYKFANAPQLSYNNYYGESSSVAMTLNEDETEATATVTNIDKIDPNCIVTGVTVSAGPPELSVTNNIANTEATNVYDGETATFTVTGKYPRYRFVNPVVTYTDTTGVEKTVNLSVTVEQYGSTATATVTDIDPKHPVTITGSYVYVVHVTSTLSNCTSADVLPDFYLQGSRVEITLQANENTEFQDTPVLSHDNDTGYYVEKEFTVSADKKTATVVYDLPKTYNVQSVTIYAESTPVQVIGGNYGSISVYLVTLENLEEFAKVRFFRETTSEGETNFEYIDLGKYVNRIKRIYCNIPSSSTDVVKCGNYNTNIDCYAPATDKITLDFGSVTVPAPNADTVDYQSEIKLFIPFAGFIDLPNDFAGEQISLQIDVNVITGNGVARLLHNGVIFNIVDLEPSTNILYRTADSELTTVGGDDWNERLYYGIDPFLFCKTFNSVNPNGRNNDGQRGVIGTFRGFNTFTDITPVSAPAMLADEQRAIYKALQRGVYIE